MSVKGSLLDETMAISCGVSTADEGWQLVVLDSLAESFAEDGSPILPWHAIQFAAMHELPPPKWVIDYFCQRASIIKNIVVDKPVDEAASIGRALGFGASKRGMTPVGSGIRIDQRDFDIAVHFLCEVERNIEQYGKPNLDAASNVVALEFEVSPSTVRTAAKSHGAQARGWIANWMRLASAAK